MSRALDAINEAIDPKSVFRQMKKVPDPPLDLVRQVVVKYERKFGRKNKWVSVHTNPHGETFLYGSFGSTSKSNVVATLLYYDRQHGWRNLNMHEALDHEHVLREALDPKRILRQVNDQGFVSKLNKAHDVVKKFKHERFVYVRKHRVLSPSLELPLWMAGRFLQDPGTTIGSHSVESFVDYAPGWIAELKQWKFNQEAELLRQAVEQLRARNVGEAIDPKNVLKAMKHWRLVNHTTEHLPKEGWNVENWIFQKWIFQKDQDYLRVEKYTEDPAHPESFYFKAMLKRVAWKRWKVVTLHSPSFEDAQSRAVKWADSETGQGPAPLGEAKIDPKRFLLKHRSQRNAEVENILLYMPGAFVQAYRNGEKADWKNPYSMDSDWWPSYDDDDAEEGTPWHEYIYYFDYRTEGGRLFAVVMSGDKDGNHDALDEAEVGTPEYQSMVKEYGSQGWADAMIRYWQWVIEQGGEDPLSYVQVDSVPVKSKWVVGFVRDGERLKVWGLRNVSDPPSPPAVKWPKLRQKAEEDPEWKKALEYLTVDEDGYLTTATEENITNDGGKWKGERLDLKFEWTDQAAVGNAQEHILEVARGALAEMEHLRQAPPDEGD